LPGGVALDKRVKLALLGSANRALVLHEARGKEGKEDKVRATAWATPLPLLWPTNLRLASMFTAANLPDCSHKTCSC
jgi:hypothetical protein